MAFTRTPSLASSCARFWVSMRTAAFEVGQADRGEAKKKKFCVDVDHEVEAIEAMLMTVPFVARRAGTNASVTFSVHVEIDLHRGIPGAHHIGAVDGVARGICPHCSRGWKLGRWQPPHPAPASCMLRHRQRRGCRTGPCHPPRRSPWPCVLPPRRFTSVAMIRAFLRKASCDGCAIALTGPGDKCDTPFEQHPFRLPELN